MKVLNLASNDYSNVSHQNANALRSVGVDCLDLTLNLHPFGYTTQSKRTNYTEIQNIHRHFDVIQVFHSCPLIYEFVKEHTNVVIYHTGTRYRENKEHFDNLFKGRTIITDQCEFLLHNETFNYLAPHVELLQKARNNKKLVIGHYPSNPQVKGTDTIEQILIPFEDDFEIRIDRKTIPHEENLKRIAECDIYLELFQPTLNGKPYGCFGVTAFEAASLGCVVITNNINRKAYEDVYGGQPFLTPNTEQALINTLISLQNIETFHYAKETFLNGFNERHGIKATGNRIKELIG
jgi:hypothetical protein